MRVLFSDPRTGLHGFNFLDQPPRIPKQGGTRTLRPAIFLCLSTGEVAERGGENTMFLRQDAPPPVPARGGPGGEPRGVGIIRGVIIIGIPPRKLRSADSPRLSVCSSVQRSTYSQCGRNARGDSWVARVRKQDPQTGPSNRTLKQDPQTGIP